MACSYPEGQIHSYSPTRVCSRHFNKEDVREPLSETGRRLLNKGAVPALFEWNNFTLPTSRPGVWERRERPPPMTEDDGDAGEKADIPMDHDYASASDPAVVDLALDDNMSLRDEILKLREHVEKLTMNQRFGIHRFAATDKDIRFFTRFASYDLLMRFWALIEPSLPNMVSVTQAQRGTFTEPSSTVTRFLQPIDEMFMFLNYRWVQNSVILLTGMESTSPHHPGLHRAKVPVPFITSSPK
ncbi:uncharacterized protein LOC109078173 [Cyprinus carpio]|uniref:Uncharacterized protein LOC109078173 n=1 Tax=Cyprinus carpio TaxID=7962 RepID=A0A9Q9YG71_CYPCA|nr:uncharacterized protein LOC109078173 [Cyprinus carpio]